MAGIGFRSPSGTNPKPRVVSDERELSSFDRGIHALAALIRPTYGPSSRHVANAGPTGLSAPEFLLDGATIARRVTEVEHRIENVGAMFLRGLLWDVQERVGDGTSTTALIFDAMYREGRRGIRAGLNASRLRHFLLCYAGILRDELTCQRVFVTGDKYISRVALSVCGDENLSRAVAHLYGGLGPHAHVEIRESGGGTLSHEFLSDAFWPATSLDNTLMLGLIGQRVALSDCAIFVSDLAIANPRDLIAVLSAAKASGAASLIMFGRSLSKPCLALIMANSTPHFRIYAMRTPETAPHDHSDSLHDIAVLTGGKVFQEAAGGNAGQVAADDIGRSRRAWVSRTHVGFFGGHGQPNRIRGRIRGLRHDLQTITERDRRNQLKLRYSRLTARSAILWIDGSTDREIDARKALGERTCRVIQDAMEHGVVLGEGKALLKCKHRLEALRPASGELEESFAIGMLKRGLGEPTRVLRANLDSGTVNAMIHGDDDGCSRNGLGHVPEPTVLDSFDVVTTALQYAITGVAQALTIDTIVLKQTPSVAFRP